MPTRIARTAWTGSLLEGSGQVEFTSSDIGTFDVSWPARANDEASSQTTPEELIGAAHSACYAMSLSSEVAKAGGTPHAIDVTAEVDISKDPNGGFKISQIRLIVRGEVDNMSADDFAKVAQIAKEGCPVSKALTGVDITLDAVLETAGT